MFDFNQANSGRARTLGGTGSYNTSSPNTLTQTGWTGDGQTFTNAATITREQALAGLWTPSDIGNDFAGGSGNTSCRNQGGGGGGGTTSSYLACVTPAIFAQWDEDAAINPNRNSSNWVQLCHGTVSNGTEIKTNGLGLFKDDGSLPKDYTPGNVYVASTLTSCQEAAYDSYNRGEHLPMRVNSQPLVDQAVIVSDIPVGIYNTYFAAGNACIGNPYPRDFWGWGPTYPLKNTGANEIGVCNNIQIGLFNYGWLIGQ